MSFWWLFCFAFSYTLATNLQNRISIENSKLGTPSNVWDVNGAGDPSIQGFAVPFGITVGETVDFRINTSSNQWRIDIYRVGYYSGDGARKVFSIKMDKASIQPDCNFIKKWRLVDCITWQTTYVWNTSLIDSLISGVYFARITREDITADHPKYNWRVDNSQKGPVIEFCDCTFESTVPIEFECAEICNTKPSETEEHNYGMRGYGQYANALLEPYASHIYFVIRSRTSSSILFQTSDTTWQAYNSYGYSSTYHTFDPRNPLPRAYKVSYNRPFVTRDHRSINSLFSAEYPAIRWLERNGFDVSYISGVDMSLMAIESNSTLLQIAEQLSVKYDVFISCGHDEYWSMEQRLIIKHAIQKYGLNALFWSGNEMYWKIRFETAQDIYQSVNDLRSNPIMTVFKESRIRDRKLDNSSKIWTGTWRDTHFAYKEFENGPFPENEITGQLYTVDTWRADPMNLPWYHSRHRIWRHNQRIKDELQQNNGGRKPYLFSKPLIGHEFDEDIDNGFRPPGLQHLTETTIHNVMYLLDYGVVYDTGSARHHLTLYRHPISDAIVFAAGSIIFVWALDDFHDSGNGIPSHLSQFYSVRIVQDLYGEITEIQQAMMNLMSDMKIDAPVTIQNGLIFDAIVDGNKVKPVSNIDIHVSDDQISGEQYGRCVRIEGRSRTLDDHQSIIAGIEVYIQGFRWFAAIIDYDKIMAENENVDYIDDYYWYFEFNLVDDNDGSSDSCSSPTILRMKSRAVDDNGYLEDSDDSKKLSEIDLKHTLKCVDDGKWRWRARPVVDMTQNICRET